jgi:hypothetical protein
MIKFLQVFTFCILILNVVHSQEKWSQDRALRKPQTNYSQLPLPLWENTNTSSRIFQTPVGDILVGPSIRVLPNSHQQDEIVLVRHPTNQSILFGGANTTTPVFAQGGYLTTDGGLTWTGTDNLPPFSQSSSDPGPTIDKDGTIIFTVLDPNMCAAYTTNNGLTWSSKVVITSTSSDKNFATSDDVPSSAYYGRSYCVWSRFTGVIPIVISYTTNGGVSWSAMAQINNPPSGHYSQGCDIAVGPAGQVYVCWAAPTNSSPFTEDFLGFAKSTDGGVTWTITENAYDMNGIRANSFNGWNFRVNSFPRIGVDRSGGVRNGWIYLVSTDRNLAPSGSDPDVILHRSTDGGTTWSAGVRVNQDAMNNGKVQFFPAIRVDEAGGVNICYYDNRNYPSVADSAETYMSRSTDGGTTWADIIVSDHRWLVKGEPGLGSYGGDYIGISSGNSKVYPFWFDDKTGSMQAWTAIVDLNIVGIGNNNNELPEHYSLGQNYPNPFNPSTNIKFQLPEDGKIRLFVSDIVGREQAVLIDGFRRAGNYEIDFNGSDMPSGVYFYTLISGEFRETRRMILIK